MPNFDPSQPLPGDDELAPTPVGAALVGALTDARTSVLPGTDPLLAKNLTDPDTGLPPGSTGVPVVVPVGAAPVPVPVPEPPPVAPAPVHGGSSGGYGITNNDTAINAASADQQAAISQEGQALAASDTAEATARHEGEQQVQQQLKARKELEVQRDAALRQLNQDSSDALEKAHNTTVPDFWEGKPGQAVTAAILVGLGAVGQGLTAFGTGVNVGNNAQNTINHAVDTYAEKKRDEINNLYKYAAAKNQLSQEQKLEWATKLNEVQFDLAATHQSIQDHLAEVAAQGRGKIDQAHYATLSADNQAHTQQLLQAAQMNRAQINHMRNEDANAAARIGIERAKATGEKADKEEDKQLQLAQSTYGKKAEIARNRLDTNADIVRSLKDPNIGGGELVQKLEQAMAINQGEGKRGVSTASLHAVAPKLVGIDGKISDEFAQALHGTAGNKLRQAVLKLGETGLSDAQREYAQQYKDFTGGAVSGYYKAHPEKVAEHAKRFYPERAPEPGALPPGAVPGTFNGKKGYALNGQFVAF